MTFLLKKIIIKACKININDRSSLKNFVLFTLILHNIKKSKLDNINDSKSLKSDLKKATYENGCIT